MSTPRLDVLYSSKCVSVRGACLIECRTHQMDLISYYFVSSFHRVLHRLPSDLLTYQIRWKRIFHYIFVLGCFNDKLHCVCLSACLWQCDVSLHFFMDQNASQLWTVIDFEFETKWNSFIVHFIFRKIADAIWIRNGMTWFSMFVTFRGHLLAIHMTENKVFVKVIQLSSVCDVREHLRHLRQCNGNQTNFVRAE